MKVRKKAKFKKRVYFLLADLVIVIVVFVLLLHKPARYNPADFVDSKEVSPYLTHELLPQLYNGLQLEEPFDLSVSQEGINDMITRSKWPKDSDGIRFSRPEVGFVPGSVVLMGTVVAGGVEFVVTVVAEASLDQGGLLHLQVAKVKIGAMNVTPLARVVIRRMYQRQIDPAAIDTKDLQAQIAASLLDNEGFEPVFKVEDKKVRAEKITIAERKLTIRLAPVFD